MSQNQEPTEAHCLKPSKTSCEVKRKFAADGKTKEYRWTLTRVSDIPGRPGDVRCPYCHGPIRLHFKGDGDKVVEDHFEHLGEGDTYHCRAGHRFPGGEHRMSLTPVE